MGVDVTPVDEVQARQPAERLEHVHRVSPAEDDDGVAGQREGQVGDLVLDHVRPPGTGRRRGELVRAHRKLAEAAVTWRAEPHVAWLAAEPVPPGEVGRVGVDPVRGKLQVEQFGEHTAVALDELGVHAGHVDLPQVHSRRLPLVDPPDGGQQLVPPVRQPEQLHRAARQPRDEPGAALGRRLGQGAEPAHLGAHAEQFPRAVVTVDPGPAGNHVGAHLTAADLLVLDAQRATPGPAPLGRPLLHLGEPLRRSPRPRGRAAGHPAAPSPSPRRTR